MRESTKMLLMVIFCATMAVVDAEFAKYSLDHHQVFYCWLDLFWMVWMLFYMVKFVDFYKHYRRWNK